MRIAYIRTDFANNLKAGGSVAHIRGVISAMKSLGHTVDFISTGYLVGLDEKQTTVVSPGLLRYLIFGIGNYIYNFTSLPALTRRLDGFKPELIYHRYSILSRVAVALALRFNIPLVLEYNGSEVWVAKNWNIPLFSLKTVEAVELFCLEKAAVVAVVSQPLKDDLVKRGIEPAKIVVNPNGADISEYHPSVLSDTEKEALRKQLGVSGKTVVGFIGTFGQWHGTPDIVEAAHILKEQGKLTDTIRFLMVGNGIMMPEVNERIARYKLETWFVMPGLIGQREAPKYLSLFDIALNPTVPNQDGSEFFGSPTKLFEYMAMGLAIISSRLGQMKDILKDGSDALLYEPADIKELAACLDKLISDPALRAKLGSAALKKAHASYTWEANVRRSLEALTPSR